MSNQRMSARAALLDLANKYAPYHRQLGGPLTMRHIQRAVFIVRQRTKRGGREEAAMKVLLTEAGFRA